MQVNQVDALCFAPKT